MERAGLRAHGPAGALLLSATEPRLLREGEAREGLPLNFADHAMYLGTSLGLT